MYDFMPYYTNDGTVGLYNSEFEDIYHSASGAMTEAYEKFIYPINFDMLMQYKEIKILDICYGIGYNTKCFLNYILKNKKKLSQKKFLKNNICTSYIETIHTYNIQKSGEYNETIYTDNIFDKITIHAIDNDKILTGISPFIKTGVKNFKNKNDVITNHDIYKYLKHKKLNNGKINNEINYLILSEILRNNWEIYEDKELQALLSEKKYREYLATDILGVFRAFNDMNLTNTHKCNKLSNLHNIYYKYLSLCYKKRLKNTKLGNISFNVHNCDARDFIKDDKNEYNLIFLDAFTPSKCPCLWSADFFEQLFKHLNENGMIFTYSSAASVRNAMINSGFYIGNIYNKRLKKYQGTVAVKNNELIEHPISEADLGLLNTRAGIFYHDENLNASNEAIIQRHKNDIETSNLMSSSKYLKDRRKNEV